MQIGEYFIDDEWSSDNESEEWHKNIILNSKNGSGAIIIFLSRTLIPGKYCTLWSFFYEEHHAMFGNEYAFDSIDEAKQNVDLFLNKFSKLKAFI